MNEVIYVQRILIMLLVAFVVFTVTGILLGQEKKAKWFKKRTKYTLFTRRSVFGEFIHFGHPCTWEGFLVAGLLFAFLFGFGYWFVFLF